MNPLLENIAEKAAADLQDLIASGEEDILTAIHKMEEEAELQETSPKFNLGFKIVADFNKHTFDCDLSWTLKQSLSTSHQIEDPTQGKLPINDDPPRVKSGIDDTKITISTHGMKPVETTLGGLKKINRKLAMKLAKRKEGDE